MDIAVALEIGAIAVKVKPGARTTELLSYDAARKEFVISVAAPADKNKANDELVRFLSKLAKRKVRIIKGKTSARKLVG